MQKLFLLDVDLEELLTSLRQIVREELANQIQLPPIREPLANEKTLTRKEVAKRLQISLLTLSRWQKKGIIKGSRLNSRIRFTENDVQEALSKTKIKQSKP